MTTPVLIEIVPSYRLTWLAVLFHLGALVAVLAGLPTGLSLYLSIAVLLSLAGTLALVRLKRGEALVCLEINAKDEVRWVTRLGEEGVGIVAKGTYCSPSLIIIRLLPGDASQKSARILLLAADSAPSEPLERLRTWLKWRSTDSTVDAHAAK